MKQLLIDRQRLLPFGLMVEESNILNSTNLELVAKNINKNYCIHFPKPSIPRKKKKKGTK